MTPQELTLSYYSYVDTKQFDLMCGLFADDILYRRGEKEISGITALRKFYTTERTIAGSHIIKEIYKTTPNMVFVKGVFCGTQNTTKTININFVDLFYFNTNQKISLRETFLATGYSIIV